MKKVITGVIFLIAIALSSFSQTTISGGDVYGNWDISSSPYFIDGDITVPDGYKLSIAPGVEVIFQGEYSFTIIGTLDARGTHNDSISFTSADTAGFSSGNYPGWKGIDFIGYTSTQTDKSILKYCKIEYSSNNGLFVMDFSNLEIDECSFGNNLGFGISVNEFSNVNIYNIKVKENISGGIAINSSDPVFSGFDVLNNSGSGISVNGSCNVILKNGTISGNITSSNGGGINVGMDANVNVENVMIVENVASAGGGINCIMGNIFITNSLIKSNYAQNGAGINGGYMSSVSLDHLLIVRNQAGENGGAIYINESDLNIVNSTIANNSALTDAGGMFMNNSYLRSATIINSIFRDNEPEEFSIGSEMPEITYSDIEGGFEGEGNIDADPLFTDPESDDYTLLWENYPSADYSKSPCIDAGYPGQAFDPDGTTTDMGAFYFDQTNITSVDKFDENDRLVLYPNPATDIINIKGTGTYTKMIISDMTGQIVQDILLTNNLLSINISDLNTGIYLVVLFDKSGIALKKKIVKK